MRIGIFEGRKASYNHEILKVLIEKEPLKAWDIAKQIAKGSMEKTQDVYATLIRRNGRLNELLEKGYIFRLPNKQFIPTFKGIIAYLLTEKNPKISTLHSNLLSEMDISDKSDLTLPFFDIPITALSKEFFECLEEMTMEELCEFKPLIHETLSWIDLDAISNEELAIILIIRLNKALLKKVLDMLSLNLASSK
jgi:hypothetical protein